MKIFKSFKQNCKQVKFGKEDYIVLDYEQLLKINGAKGNSNKSVEKTASSPIAEKDNIGKDTNSNENNHNENITQNNDNNLTETTPTDTVEVKSGDTLADLTWEFNNANGTHYTAKEVAEMNGIEDPNLIEKGQTITFGKKPDNSNGAISDAPERQNQVQENNVSNDYIANSSPKEEHSYSNAEEKSEENREHITPNMKTDNNTPRFDDRSTEEQNSVKIDKKSDEKNKVPACFDPNSDVSHPKYSPTGIAIAKDRINVSIRENFKKKYDIKNGYMCDNWVEEVINDAGYNSGDYLLAGSASSNTVADHIEAIKKDSGYTTILPNSDGAYVVLMSDGLPEHAALLVVENGVYTLLDNSSTNGGKKVYETDEQGNVKKDKYGNDIISYYEQGVAEHYGVKISADFTTLPDYGYNTFYCKQIH